MSLNSIVSLFKRGITLSRRALSKKGWRTAIYISVLTISGAFIAFIFYRNWAELSQQQWKFDPLYLVLAMMIFSLGELATIAAWHQLLKALGVNLPFCKNVRIYSLSAIPRHVPGLVLYFTSRSLLYEDEDVPISRTLIVTTLDIVIITLTGLIASIPMFLLSISVLREYPFILWAAIIAVIVLLSFLFFTPALDKILGLVLRKQTSEIPKLNRRSLLFNLLWMFIAWIIMGLMLFFFTRSIIIINWNLLPVMIGVWGASSAISLTIGALIQGFGIREVTMGALLSLVISPVEAVVVAIGFRLVYTLAELLWIFLFILITKPPSKKREGG